MGTFFTHSLSFYSLFFSFNSMFHWKCFKSTATPNDRTAVPKSKPTANTSWGARKGTESQDFGWNDEARVRHFWGSAPRFLPRPAPAMLMFWSVYGIVLCRWGIFKVFLRISPLVCRCYMEENTQRKHNSITCSIPYTTDTTATKWVCLVSVKARLSVLSKRPLTVHAGYFRHSPSPIS